MLDLKYSTILKMAVPLMASSFIQSIVLITDSSFLSRYSTLDFDASGNAGLIYVTMFVALVGINDGGQILMARRIGENKEDRLAKIFGSTLLINLIIASILFCIIQFLMPDLIQSYTNSDILGVKQAEFIRIRSFALFFAMVSLAINAYFMAHGKTTIVLLSALFTAVSNVFLDYSMIWGEFGFSELGLKGAAWASTISDGIGMLFLIIALIVSKEQRRIRMLQDVAIAKEQSIEVLRLGSPIMFQLLVALSVWTIFFSWIEQMGTHELTISQNIRSIYFLTFVPIWGFGATTKTYISQYLGAKRYDEISLVQRRIQILTIIFLFVFVHGALLYPETLIGIINPHEAYLTESANILRMVFGSLVMYGVISVYFQTINGSGNTRFTFYIELMAVFGYLIVSYILIKVIHADIFWVWIVEYVYFGIIGAASILYLRYANWKTKLI